MYHILQFQSSVYHFYIVLLLLAPTALVPLQRLRLWRMASLCWCLQRSLTLISCLQCVLCALLRQRRCSSGGSSDVIATL